MNSTEVAVEDDSLTDSGAVVDGKWEYRPLRIPAGVSRPVAAAQLAIRAEFAGWELSNVRLYADGSRKVWLRRRHYQASHGLPGVIV